MRNLKENVWENKKKISHKGTELQRYSVWLPCHVKKQSEKKDRGVQVPDFCS